MYPMICLFGNLSVHARLDRKSIQSILRLIENQFEIPEAENSTNDEIATLFSIRELQQEMLSFQGCVE